SAAAACLPRGRRRCRGRPRRGTGRCGCAFASAPGWPCRGRRLRGWTLSLHSEDADRTAESLLQGNAFRLADQVYAQIEELEAVQVWRADQGRRSGRGDPVAAQVEKVERAEGGAVGEYGSPLVVDRAAAEAQVCQPDEEGRIDELLTTRTAD